VKELQELQQGIYLRKAREEDARAIAALVKQLGQTLQGPDDREFSLRNPLWLMLLWALVGFSGVLALYHGISLKMILSIGLGTIAPLIFFGGMIWLITWLNPLITWSDYWVIEHNGSIVACAKLYEGNNTSELYDVFVVTHWRGYGFGTALVQTLIGQARYPLYLACLPDAIGFYETLGFACTNQVLDPALMRRLSLQNPRYQKLGLTAMVQK
jgi:N-acetylglutamate synthase-like GNAT family acetyltransferase